MQSEVQILSGPLINGDGIDLADFAAVWLSSGLYFGLISLRYQVLKIIFIRLISYNQRFRPLPKFYFKHPSFACHEFMQWVLRRSERVCFSPNALLFFSSQFMLSAVHSLRKILLANHFIRLISCPNSISSPLLFAFFRSLFCRQSILSIGILNSYFTIPESK